MSGFMIQHCLPDASLFPQSPLGCRVRVHQLLQLKSSTHVTAHMPLCHILLPRNFWESSENYVGQPSEEECE